MAAQKSSQITAIAAGHKQGLVCDYQAACDAPVLCSVHAFAVKRRQRACQLSHELLSVHGWPCCSPACMWCFPPSTQLQVAGVKPAPAKHAPQAEECAGKFHVRVLFVLKSKAASTA